MTAAQIEKLEEFQVYIDQLKLATNVRFIKGFKVTIRNTIDLHADLSQKHGIQYLITSRYFCVNLTKSLPYSFDFFRIQQDYVESMFSLIRAADKGNRTPSSYEFSCRVGS